MSVGGPTSNPPTRTNFTCRPNTGVYPIMFVPTVTAQAEGVGQLQTVALHLHRVKVVEHVVHRRERAVARRVAIALAQERAGPEYRLPYLRVLRLVSQKLQLLG